MISLSLRRSRSFELDLAPRSHAPESRVLVFNVPRSATLLAIGGVPGLERVPRGEPNVIELRRTNRGKTPSQAKITVTSVGGTPELAKRVYVDGSGSLEVVEERGRAVEREGGLFGPKEFLQSLRDALYAEEPPTTINRYRRFFYDLNRHTEPTLLQAVLEDPAAFRDAPTAGDAKRVFNALPFVRRALSVRMATRMREHRETPHHCTPFQDAASFRTYVEVVSNVFLRLLHHHFPAPDGTLDIDTFEEAFEMFSAGELRLWMKREAVATNHPNSGAFFLFGEFALLAAECDIEPALWTRLGNVMIRSQALFCATYPPLPIPGSGDGGPKANLRPCLADFQGANFQPDRRPAQSERRALCEVHRGFGLRELSQAAVRNLARLAPGEFDLLPAG